MDPEAFLRILIQFLQELLDEMKQHPRKIKSGIIERVSGRITGEATMADTIQVDEIVHMRVRWFSGPNGTGKELTPTVDSTEASDSPNATVASTGLQTFDVTGVSAGLADITATDPTSGVIAAPYPFTVTPLVIMSGVIERVPTA